MQASDLGHSLWVHFATRGAEHPKVTTERIGSLARLLCGSSLGHFPVDLPWGTLEPTTVADAIMGDVDIRGFSDETLGIFFIGLHELRTLKGAVVLHDVTAPPVAAVVPKKQKKKKVKGKSSKRKTSSSVAAVVPAANVLYPAPAPIQATFIADELRFTNVGKARDQSRTAA